MGFGPHLAFLPAAVVRVRVGLGVVGLPYHAALTLLERDGVARPWPLSALPDSIPRARLRARRLLRGLARGTPLRPVLFAALAGALFYFWFVPPARVLRGAVRRPPRRPRAAGVEPHGARAGVQRGGVSRSAIDSLVEARHPGEKEGVVGDGSTDRTTRSHAPRHRRGDRAPEVERGKRSALNYGPEWTNGDAVVTVDADSVVAEKRNRAALVATRIRHPSNGAARRPPRWTSVSRPLGRFVDREAGFRIARTGLSGGVVIAPRRLRPA